MGFGDVIYLEHAKVKIGTRIRNAIKDKGYTYRKVESGTKIKHSHVSNLANGKILPTLETIFRLSEYLEVDYKYLISDLEMFIKPTGFNYENETPSLEEEARYQIEVEREYNRYLNREYPVFNTDNLKPKIKLREIIEWKATDSSMNLLNISNNSIVNVIKLEESEASNNGKVYLLKLDEKEMVRRIWVLNDKIILIPYSTNPKYSIEEVEVSRVGIIGIVDSVYSIIK